MILDIDNFRLINEMYSREMGDNVFRTVSRFIQAMLPENAALYRLDKDRMGILAGYVTKCEMWDLYQRIQKMLLQITEWRAYGFKVEVSAGCSGYPQDGCMVNELLQYAEYALLYQPQIDGKGEQIKGVEALARFQDEEGVPVAVTEFLPILEEHGMIVPFGKWVARTAMQNGKKWLVRNPDFKVSINASALQLMQADFASDILRIAEEEGFPYKNLNVFRSSLRLSSVMCECISPSIRRFGEVLQCFRQFCVVRRIFLSLDSPEASVCSSFFKNCSKRSPSFFPQRSPVHATILCL